MGDVIPITKNKRPHYYAYQRKGDFSEGATLMLARMGLRWCPELRCWTNAPEHWTLAQISVLLSPDEK